MNTTFEIWAHYYLTGTTRRVMECTTASQAEQQIDLLYLAAPICTRNYYIVEVDV